MMAGIRYGGQRRDTSFTTTEYAVMLCPKLSDGAVRLYWLLRHYCRDKEVCFPGQERLAGQLVTSIARVRRLLRELERVGVLETRRKGKKLPNDYFLPEITPELAALLLGVEKNAE